jgi:hypothetical protein
MLATDYPLLEVFWTMLIFFGFVIWIWVLFTVFADIFRRRDIGGWGKALWIVFVVILPWLGVLVYLIAEHQGMTERAVKQQQDVQAEFDQSVKYAAGKGDPTDQIAKARELLDKGAISQAEFEEMKRKALAASMSAQHRGDDHGNGIGREAAAATGEFHRALPGDTGDEGDPGRGL